MDRKLHQLETFAARGSDGRTYSVHGYEHLGRIDAFIFAQEQWEPLGIAEYRLADGQHVTMKQDGSMVIDQTGVELTRETNH